MHPGGGHHCGGESEEASTGLVGSDARSAYTRSGLRVKHAKPFMRRVVIYTRAVYGNAFGDVP